MNDNKKIKKPVVEADKCIGCGLCTSIAPGTFVMKGSKSIVVDKPTDSDKIIQEAVESCPTGAIS